METACNSKQDAWFPNMQNLVSKALGPSFILLPNVKCYEVKCLSKSELVILKATMSIIMLWNGTLNLPMSEVWHTLLVTIHRGRFKGGHPQRAPPCFYRNRGMPSLLLQKQGIWLCVGAQTLQLFFLKSVCDPHWKFLDPPLIYFDNISRYFLKNAHLLCEVPKEWGRGIIIVQFLNSVHYIFSQ